MAKFIDRYSISRGLLENPYEAAIKIYELQKVVDGERQPVDKEAMRGFKEYLNDVCVEEVKEIGSSLSDIIGFSIISDGFGGFFRWADKEEGYNVLYEIPFKHDSSGWSEGDFDEMGIACVWYNKVIEKENDLWTELVLKPGTPPDILDNDFQENVAKYTKIFIPEGSLFSKDSHSELVNEHLAHLNKSLSNVEHHTTIP